MQGKSRRNRCRFWSSPGRSIGYLLFQLDEGFPCKQRRKAASGVRPGPLLKTLTQSVLLGAANALTQVRISLADMPDRLPAPMVARPIDTMPTPGATHDGTVTRGMFEF